MTRDRKREAYLRATGRGLTVTGPDQERVVRRVRSFHARGMTYAQMDRQTGVSWRTIAQAVEPGRSHMLRSTWQSLAGLRFEEPDPHAWVSPAGTRRRLGALWAAGYPLPFLADLLPWPDRHYLRHLLSGRKGARGVEYANAQAVSALYDKLSDACPADLGVAAHPASFARSFARKKGFAPPHCWDVDALDDPEALPEWTGRCGTWWGWRAHQRDGIPVCARCEPFTGSPAYPGFDGALLRSLRERKGYSRIRLGRAAGIDPITIQHWESGRSRPGRTGRLDLVLSVLDVSPEEVCDSEQEGDA